MADEAERWLKKNDPEYADYKTRRHAEYPFHTKWQSFLRDSKEVPVSSFDGKQTRKVSLGNGNCKIDRCERPYGMLQYLE